MKNPGGEPFPPVDHKKKKNKKQVQNDDHIISGVHWWLYENNYMTFSFRYAEKNGSSKSSEISVTMTSQQKMSNTD
jgi:hypothetical protein